MDSPFLQQLRREEQKVRAKIEELRKPIAQAEEDLKSILGTISYCERAETGAPSGPNHATANITIRVNPAAPMIPARLHGLSHRQAVIAIAKHNGGALVAQDAKRLMIEAGIMRETKNSTHMVHNAIINSERFERTGRGTFRLKVTTPPSGTPVAAMAAGIFPGLKSPLQ